MKRHHNGGLLFLALGILLMPSVVLPLFSGVTESATPRAQPPVAIISHPTEQEAFSTNESIEFNGSSSYDPDGTIVQWDWWFADGTTVMNASETMYHSYKKEARYHAHLMVTDQDGLTSNASVTVTITDTFDPIAQIAEPQPSTTKGINQTIIFSAIGSMDPRGGNLTFHWNFGDGTASDEPSPSHQYSTVGRYSIELTVHNESGGSGFTAQLLFIRDDVPVVVIHFPVDGGIYNINDTIFFSPEGTYDPNGDMTWFVWYFGDLHGQYNSSGPPTSTTYKYSNTGNYAISLTVQDSALNRVLETIQLTITDQYRPLVAIISSPANGSTFRVNTSIPFDGSYSCYSGSTIRNAIWDLDDGSNTICASVCKHMYSQEGQYRVKLRVSDDSGNGDQAWIVVNIINISKPVAVIFLHPRNENVWNYVEFDGSRSYCSGGNISIYQWDFGDGEKSDKAVIGHTYSESYTYPKANSYMVILNVSDGELWGTTTIWLALYPVKNAKPDIQFTSEAKPDGNNFPPGELISFSYRGNLDTNGTADYYWDFGDGNNTTGTFPSHFYDRPGRYEVRLRLEAGNYTTTAFRNITIKPIMAQNAISYPFGLVTAIAFILIVVIGLTWFFGGTELGVYSAFSFLMFVYTKIKREEILDNYIRGQIHGYIVANPGDHYNSILKALKLNNGTLAWHIRKLEDEGVVKARTDGIHKRFYPSETAVPEPDGGALTEVQRMIMAKVRETPGISQKDIAGLLKVSGSTVNYHIGTLVVQGKVRQERDGMKVRYFTTQLAPHNGEKDIRNDPG
jgi:PKD repeat protein